MRFACDVDAVELNDLEFIVVTSCLRGPFGLCETFSSKFAVRLLHGLENRHA